MAVGDYFKIPPGSYAVPVADLIQREPPDPARLKEALDRMAAAKSGKGPKRNPISVSGLQIIDGNTTYHALRKLGEPFAVVRQESKAIILN